MYRMLEHQPYIVWNPANTKVINRSAIPLLKPNRYIAEAKPMGKPLLKINMPFSTE